MPAPSAASARCSGVGTSELAHILVTQVMAIKRPKRMRVRLDGALGAHVSAKTSRCG